MDLYERARWLWPSVLCDIPFALQHDGIKRGEVEAIVGQLPRPSPSISSVPSGPVSTMTRYVLSCCLADRHCVSFLRSASLMFPTCLSIWAYFSYKWNALLMDCFININRAAHCNLSNKGRHVASGHHQSRKSCPLQVREFVEGTWIGKYWQAPGEQQRGQGWIREAKDDHGNSGRLRESTGGGAGECS